MSRPIPSCLLTARERKEITADEEKRIEPLRARARTLGVERSPGSWTELRRVIGRRRDRSAALKLICAATSYRPLPKQLKLHLAQASGERTNKFYCGGIGSGKSHAGIVEDGICILANPGVRGLIVAPTYDQVLHVLLPRFLLLCEQMEQAGYPILKRFRWSQMRAELVCGGEVFFRSVSKVDNLLGFEFAWWHFDECETVPTSERIWNVLSGRLRQQAQWRQTLCTSTPRGLRGVVAIFQAAREDAANDNEIADKRREFYFIRSTTFDNPHLPAEYIESLRKTLSKAAWRQEVMAEILRPESAVFPEFERLRHSLPMRSRAEFVELLKARRIPWDLAYDAGLQFPHVLWIARFAECDVVFDELCEDGMTEDRLHTEVVRRCAELGSPPVMVVCDRAVTRERTWAGETFTRSELRVMDKRREQSVAEGIKIVRNRLDPNIGDPGLMIASYLWDTKARRAIVKCLQNYRYMQQAHGALSETPWKDNVHDHGVDALRMHQMARHGEAFRLTMMTRRYGGGERRAA